MKINRLFTIAAATLMMVACSSEETALNNTPAAGSQMQFTATIAAPNSGATTRTEYTEVTTGEAAGTINVAWKVGDEIALIHNGVKDVATVKTVNADGSATIAGIITKAENEAGVELVYPSALVTSVTSDGNPVFDNDLWERISTQDGTLKYIQDNLDFRRAKGQLSVNETSATLKEAATMKSMHAIWKLTLQNDAETPAALSAKQVSVQLTADVPILRARTAELTTPISSFYLAMEPFPVAPITILATVDEDTYSYVKEGVALEAGKYYQSTVTMAKAATDLSKLTADYTVKNGETLTGTLAGNYKISIAAGATVTLDGVTINGANSGDFKWAGITCEGDATIILKDETTNKVTGFSAEYPGIYVPSGNTLTIKGETKGTGSLNASSNGNGAGIGGGYGNSINCGNIVIEGGDITATGSSYAAGIGSASNTTCGSITISGGTITANGGEYAAGIGTGYGDSASCGDITISGGTVTATGGENGAGIGTGKSGSCYNITISGGTVSATGGEYAAGIGSGINWADCGNITITTGVTQVTVTKGNEAPNSIGPGYKATCGTITIGGAVVDPISTSPYVYPVPTLNLTSPAVGQVIGDDGKNYDYASLPGGVTAVAKICYVSGSNGLALALADESSSEMTWNTAKSTCSGKTPTITGGTWKLASQDEWNQMINAVGGYAALRDGFSSVGGTNMQSSYYWSSTPTGYDCAWACNFSTGNWDDAYADNYTTEYVRACLAF